MNHKQLVQQMAEMEVQMQRYQAELSNLRNQVASYENVETSVPAVETGSSRRKMLKRMAIAGFGGIGALGLAASIGSNNTVLAATASNNAIEAIGGNDGYGLQASGFAPLRLIPVGGGATPVAGRHEIGELWVDSAGALYYCIAATTTTPTNSGGNVAWRKLAGATTSGTLHLLANPARFIDTRPSPNQLNDANRGPFGNGEARTYNLTALTGSGGATIPAHATGVIGNITVVGADAAGFGSIYPNSYNGTSTINFNAGDTLANSFSSALSTSGNLVIQTFLPGHTHVLLDIGGYYL